MEVGVHLPNGPLDDQDRALLRPFQTFLVYDTGEPWVLDQVRWVQSSGGRYHLRVEARGGLGDPEAEARMAAERVRRLPGPPLSLRWRNEPNVESPGLSPEEWRRWLALALRAVRGFLPQGVRVAAPAVSPGTPDWRAWLSATADAAMTGGADLLDIHAYGWPEEVRTVVEAACGVWPKTFLLTETNFGAGRAENIAAYAQALPTILALCRVRRVEGVFWFIWRWERPDISLPQPVDLVAQPLLREVWTTLAQREREATMRPDYPGALWVGSPNYGYPQGMAGRNGEGIVAIVDHIAEGTAQGVIAWFQNPQSQASAHYLVARDGTVYQFVRETDAAWANGIDFSKGYEAYRSDLSIPWIKECWDRRINPNLRTISIEHEGFSGRLLTEEQVQATVALHRYLVRKYGIPVDPTRIVGHNRIDAVNRAGCPGPAFPWPRLFAALRGSGTGSGTMTDEQKKVVLDHLGVMWGYMQVVQRAGEALQSAVLLEAAKAFQERIVALKQALGLG